MPSPPDNGDTAVAVDAPSVQAALSRARADSECSARNILDPTAVQVEFKEGLPRHCEPVFEAFLRRFTEAIEYEQRVSDAEVRLEQDVRPWLTEQLLAVFRAWKLVTEGKLASDFVENFLAERGVIHHGNEKIRCSPLVRAVVLQNERKGTPRFERKRQRAATYASAVDFAAQEKMTEEDFEAELRHPPTPGERHGLEHLAALGRKLRHGEVKVSCEPPDDMPFRVEGDFADIKADYRLMLIKVQGESGIGALLEVSESLLRRVLAANHKLREPNNQG
jgi:hypothetical protein